MTQEHPITPPPELVVEWADTVYQQTECDEQRDLYIATQAARWGADQELEACCADLRMVLRSNQADWLRSVRRPQPPSLKEQALDALACATFCTPEDKDVILRALRSLPR